MKPKTIIIVLWPISVLLIGWLGLVVGTRLGTEVGMSEYHAERVRRFQLDVAEVAGSTDAPTRELLLATANLAGQMSDLRAYAAASEEFAAKIKELQSKRDGGNAR